MLDKHGSLANLLLPGTSAKHDILDAVAAAVDLALRERMTLGPILSSGTAVIDHLRFSMAHLQIEEVRALFVDSGQRLIAEEVVSRGTVDAAIVYPREVLRRALLLNASGLILVHNHPSGDPNPTNADLVLTRKIVEGGVSLGISLNDHLIMARGGWRSLRADGLLNDNQDGSATLTGDAQLKSLARDICRLRMIRTRHFESGLFHDPAWDMLLDLFISYVDGRPTSVSSLCIASCVPPTTALRYINALQISGAIAREDDTIDRRRQFVRLTAAGFIKMRSILATLAH